MILGDPQSRVAHPDPSLAPDQVGRDHDLSTMGRILDRVREEVPDDLRKPVPVCADDQRAAPEGSEHQLVQLALR